MPVCVRVCVGEGTSALLVLSRPIQEGPEDKGVPLIDSKLLSRYCHWLKAKELGLVRPALPDLPSSFCAPQASPQTLHSLSNSIDTDQSTCL